MATTPQRRAGILTFKVSGTQHDAKGNFTYGLGGPKKEGIAGADRVHGFKETVQIPFIEGEITDRSELDLKALFDLEDETVTLELANGKTVLLRNAWFAGDRQASTEEAAIPVRFEGLSAEED